MKKAVIYARYSSDSQTEQSIEGQLRVCKEYAKNNNILVVDTYIDRAMTGTNDMRPDFQRMLKDSAKHQWEIVLVYKLDRFSRDKYETTIHKHTLKENGVKLMSAMENIPDTPEGIILESLLEGMNQYYSAELAQKINRGLKESWSKGQTTGGRTFFGYDVIDKKCVINEYESSIVLEAFTKYAQGYKARAIVAIFKEKGYRRKNGQYIDENYLYRILRNIRYTGIVEHQGVIYDKIFPRIVSDELWQAVSAITDDNKIAPSRKKEIFDFLLSGKLVCGNCKHRMVGISGTSHTGDSHYYYACQAGRRKKVKCPTKPIRKQYLEDIVIDTTVKLLSSVSIINELAQKIYDVHQNETADDTALKSLEQRRKEALRAQSNMIKAIEQGIITEATKGRLTELETEINHLDFEIAKEKAHNYAFLTVEQIEHYLSRFVFDNPTDMKVRKFLINAFVREVILYDDEVVITYNFTDSPEHLKINKEQTLREEQQIERAKSSFSFDSGSTILAGSPPQLKKMNPILSGSFSFRGLCAAMPCRLRREPLRAGAAFMRVNSLTSLLRKRCLLRTPSSPPQLKKTNPILSGSFSFRGLCTAMPCRLRREPLRADRKRREKQALAFAEIERSGHIQRLCDLSHECVALLLATNR